MPGCGHNAGSDRFITGSLDMVQRILGLILAVLLLSLPARAQDNLAPPGKVWVQVATETDLATATSRAQRFAREFEFTRIFVIEPEGYAIALGVVNRSEAAATVRSLIRRGRIPRDTVTTRGEDYLLEIWSAKRKRIAGDGFAPEFAEALKLDRRLSASQRRATQLALIWSGELRDMADGRIGPRTRAAIRSFQRKNDLPPTGYLTYDQFDMLIAARDRAQRAVGWRVVEDGPLGLRIRLAAALFDAPRKVDVGLRLQGRGPAAGATLSLLSLKHGRRSLDNLYDAAKGNLDRGALLRRTADGFLLRGLNGRRVLFTAARREGDAVRGFLLSYPADLAPLLDPVAFAMQAAIEIRPVRSRPLLAEENLNAMKARTDWGKLLPPAARPDDDEQVVPAGRQSVLQRPDW